jgi:hypothetical protein
MQPSHTCADGDDPNAFLEDHDFANKQSRLPLADAQAMIAAFADNSDAGAWTSLDRATVAGKLAKHI